MKGRNICLLLSYGLLSCLTIAANGQENSRNLFFNELNQRNGLSGLSNMYLTRDSRGYIWLGGFNGLFRFDGKVAKLYPSYLGDGSLDISISSRVFEDRRGRLWFTTYGAIHCLDQQKDKLEPITLKDSSGTACYQHYAFHLDKNDCLWVVAGKKLHLFNVFTRKDTVLHELDTFIAYAIEDDKGKVEAVAVPLPDRPFGIEIFDYTSKEGFVKNSYFTPNDQRGLPPARVLFLSVEGDSVLWLPTDREIIRFPWCRPLDYKVVSSSVGNKNANFWDLSLWQRDYIWATSPSSGLHFFDKKGTRHESISTISIDNRSIDISKANNILLDQDENLWISSWDKGVYFANLRQSKFRHVLKPTLTQNHSIISISQDKKGKIWCLSQEEGLFELNNQGILIKQYNSIPSINDGKSEGRLSSIFSDTEGDTWISSGRKIYLRDAKSGNFSMIGKNLDGVSNIIQIDSNRFLLLTLTHLFEIGKTKNPIDFQLVKPLAKWDRLYQLYWDGSNLLFIADSFDKLMIYQIGTDKIDLLTEIKNIGTVYGIVKDYKSDLHWLATDHGLMKMLPGNLQRLIPVTDKRKILSQPLKSVLQDSSGNLWLGTNTGIFKYDPKTNTTKHYTESDGLQGLLFMPGSACKLSGGRIAFGGLNGLNIFHPDSVIDNPTKPIVHITEIMVNDTGHLPGVNPETLEKWTFPYEERNLFFRFVAIEYSSPKENTFAYQLVGYDNDTVYAGTIDYAKFSNLPSKIYTLKVWAINSDGIWTGNPREFTFTIRPHWTNTLWFKSFVAIATLAVLYAFYLFRINQIRKQEEMLRKDAEFKQKEAEIKQQVSETETAILRLQMNPHFIFNSMNSISSYILKKDIATANNYLSRFAKLMRMILDLAAKPRIAITDEIELLELYMNTEAMRFEQKFTYDIQVDKSLDPDEVLVPTMLLQPFVENAIWHGLSRKIGPGHIIIHFEDKNGILACSVEDNGVGRILDQTQKQHGHDSRALGITTRRLQLLEDETKIKCYYEIIDLKDALGNPSGTRVELHIPILEE